MINWFKKRFGISEEQLIQRVQNGDKEAFGKLYLAYLDRIYRYIFFRVNQHKETAEDLTETVFLKALQHITKYSETKGTFQSWIYRIAHNTVLDHYKSYKSTSTVQEDTAAVEEIELLEERLDKQEQIKLVTAAMVSLTDEQRNIISLRFIEELSHKEIALIVEKQEEAVRAIQYRGLQALKKQLKKK